MTVDYIGNARRNRMGEKYIKSFEIAENDEFGDIVSKKRKAARHRLKVGLLPLSWFEWWPMFPESDMMERIQGDCRRFLEIMQEKFGDTYELVCPDDNVDTLNSAYDIGEYFAQQGVEALVVDEATYVTDFIPIEAMDLLPDIPVILFVSQATENLWPGMTNTDIIRFEGMVGTLQLAGALTKMGRSYRTVVGSLETDEAFEEIGKHLLAIQLLHDLKHLDIGIIGHTFRGMYDIEIDKTKIKGVFGPNVLYIDVTHLTDIWKKITDEEIQSALVPFRDAFPVPFEGIEEEDVQKSVRLGLAVERLIDRFGLGAMTMLGQHHVEVATRASADLSFYFAEDTGCMTAHEGDLANLVMKYILHRISGDLPVFLEWSAFDAVSDTLLLTHHGVVDPKIHSNDLAKTRVTPSPEKWDFTGNGFSIEYCAKGGTVTLASLLDGKNGWKLLLSRGENVELPVQPCRAPQWHFKHEKYGVKEYVRRAADEGVAHHVCLVYGDYTEILRTYAYYAGIEVVEI